MQRNLAYGVVRTTLIGYGVTAFAFFQFGSSPGIASQAAGFWGSARGFIVLGIGLQLILMLARALTRRYVADEASATRITDVFEVIADGVTVLLFAMATLGPITRLANDV